MMLRFSYQWAHVPKKEIIKRDLSEALRIGKGRILLTSTKGEKQFWYSTSRVDSLTGEAYPELEPSLLSWNSAKGGVHFVVDMERSMIG